MSNNDELQPNLSVLFELLAWNPVRPRPIPVILVISRIFHDLFRKCKNSTFQGNFWYKPYKHLDTYL